MTAGHKARSPQFFAASVRLPKGGAFLNLIYPRHLPAREIDMIDKTDAAVATLENLGYTHEGGSLWKPPLGKAPDFNMLDSLRARAASLEDQLIAQANRAVIAEQEVIALTQRLAMANRLNTDARNQLASSALPSTSMLTDEQCDRMIAALCPDFSDEKFPRDRPIMRQLARDAFTPT
jgi:hypothetical protein